MNLLGLSFERRPSAISLLAPVLCTASAVVILFASHLVRAEAGPPFFTDDPGTPEYHHWEINLAVTAENRGSERTMEAPLIDVNYGLFPNTELNVEIPYVAQKQEGNRVESVGDISVGFKWRFYELPEVEAEEKTFSIDGISVYPQIGFPSRSTRGNEEEAINHHPAFVLPVQVGAHWGPWGIGTEVGVVLQSQEDAKYFVGGVVSRSFGRCTLGLELYSAEPNRASSRIVIANLGAIVSVTDHYAVLISVGRELVNRQETRASLLMFVGQQIAF